MRSLSFNCGVQYLLFIIYFFTKYAWVIPLKDKKCKTVLHGFIEIVNGSKCQIKCGLIEEKNFIIILCKNG